MRLGGGLASAVKEFMELAENIESEISILHKEALDMANFSIEKILRIGDLLIQKKAELKHGEWIPWIESKLPFDRKQAFKYITIFKNKENVSLSGHLQINTLCKQISDSKRNEKIFQPVVIDNIEGVTSDLRSLDGRKFGCIYADPPWKYGNQGTRAATDNHYDTMTIEDICNLPVSQLAADQCHLHLWTTNGFLFECPKIFEAWGFEFKSSFVWVKPQMGIGNYWRNSHEIMLLAVKGGLTAQHRGLMSWGSFDRTKHSAKPRQIREMIQKISPGPYLELFGRSKLDGWNVFGNQIDEGVLL